LFLARVNQEIVGYVLAGERENDHFYISHIGVRSDCKRRGIGRSLLLECEWYAEGRSYLAVTTTTYNRYRGMLLLLIQEGYYIQGTTWVEGAREPRISLRKELKT
jgi:ribosomal protein S18 acetylase RimI-like enzyme